MSLSTWDFRYLEMAKLVASWSKDPNAQVGAVIVQNNRVVATGFNGFPSEVLDHQARLNDKKTKLEMVVHAEENALIVAGKSSNDAEIYVYGKPVCPRCAGSIIQAGITRVIAERPKRKNKGKWDKPGDISLEMFAEAGVQFHSPSNDSDAEIRTSSFNEPATSSSSATKGNGSSSNGAHAPSQ